MRSLPCKGPPPDPPPRLRRLLPLAGVLALLCGCSQTLVVFRGDERAEAPVVADEPVATGSIDRRPVIFGPDMGQEDWRRANVALGAALDPQGNGRPVKWENPETALRGSVNPTGLPYLANDLVCRDFLASVIAPAGSRFVRGTGCRVSGSDWELKRLRFRKSSTRTGPAPAG